jgi:hypothetical protein
VKWDLENGCPMEGQATRRVLRMLKELEEEGRL